MQLIRLSDAAVSLRSYATLAPTLPGPFFLRQLSTPRNSKNTHTTSTSHATSSVVIPGPRTN